MTSTQGLHTYNPTLSPRNLTPGSATTADGAACQLADSESEVRRHLHWCASSEALTVDCNPGCSRTEDGSSEDLRPSLRRNIRDDGSPLLPEA